MAEDQPQLHFAPSWSSKDEKRVCFFSPLGHINKRKSSVKSSGFLHASCRVPADKKCIASLGEALTVAVALDKGDPKTVGPKTRHLEN